MLEYFKEAVKIEIENNKVPVGIVGDYRFATITEAAKLLYKRLNKDRLSTNNVISINECTELAEKLINDLKLQYLTEMSYPCKKKDGFGMIIELHSDDHGEIGNEDSPAHVHVFDTNKSKVGEIVVTPERPSKPKDVVPYRCKLPDGYAKNICKWANATTSNPPQNNWDYLQNEWNRRRPD